MVDKVFGTRLTSTKPASVDAAEKSTVKAGGTSDDKTVTTSTTGQTTLERAMQIAKETPEIDRQKVDEIKNAIARGEFKIDPKAIAKAFIDMTYSQ